MATKKHSSTRKTTAKAANDASHWTDIECVGIDVAELLGSIRVALKLGDDARSDLKNAHLVDALPDPPTGVRRTGRSHRGGCRQAL